MTKLTNNSAELKSKLLYFLVEGYSLDEIKASLAISHYTLRHFLKDAKFKERYDRAFEEGMRNLIYKNLRQAASGQEVREVSKEYIKEEMINGEPTAVKVKETVKQVPPDLKAISLLANKFENALVKSDTAHNVNVTISSRDRSLSISERIALLESEKSNVIEVDAGDYKELLDEEGS